MIQGGVSVRAGDVKTLRAGAGGRPRMPWSERYAPVGLCVLLLLQHLAGGGALRDQAMLIACLDALALAMVLLASGWARRTLASGRRLLVPAVLFAAVLGVAIWSMTPWVPGGPHPAWQGSGSPGAAVLDRGATTTEIVRLLSLACVFLLGWLIASDDRRGREFLITLALGGGVLAAYAFAVYVASPPPPPSGPAPRLADPFLSANTAGACFGILVVLQAVAATDAWRSAAHEGPGRSMRGLQRSTPYLVALVFAAGCLLLSASRGAFVATTLALGVFLVWEALARRWRLNGPGGLALLAAAAAGILLLATSGGRMMDRLLTGTDAVDGRAVIAAAHWHAFLASPWMGYGLGGFGAVNRLAMTSDTYAALFNVRAAHNVYLQWLEEAGILGAAPMFLCIAAVLAIIVLGSWRRTRMTTWLRGVAAASLVLLLHGASDFALQIPSMAAFWAALLGAGAGMSAGRSAR